MEVERLETSRAAFRCLERSGLRARLAPPWEAEEGAYDLVVLALPAGRGSQYVALSLLAAARALRPLGRVYLAGDKNKGFERYFKEAKALLGYGEVVAREGAYRVALLEKEKAPPPLPPCGRASRPGSWARPTPFTTSPGSSPPGGWTRPPSSFWRPWSRRSPP
jgi:16S rRNA (guanine1207-N2)-methyltransferase